MWKLVVRCSFLLLMLPSSSIVSSFIAPTPPFGTPRRIGKASRQYLSIQEQEDFLLEQASQNVASTKPDVIFILMYNPGTEQEGVHSTEYPKESGSEVMLGFESIEDCISFANMLKADPTFPLEPVPTPTPLPQMESAVAEMGLSIMVVPSQQT